MTIAILGAGGFLGSNLIPYVLTHTKNHIIAISHHPALHKIDSPRVTYIEADIFDEEQLTDILRGVEVAYFFVHMMGQKNKDFYTQEAVSANRFSAAVIAAGVKRVIYMGGLGDDHEQLSAHLASRHNTGTILRENCPLVLEFRASMIIGKGSVAFDIIDNLVRKLPIMVLPHWSNTLTQPIALQDALAYLEQAATVTLDHSHIIEIGGPSPLSYRQLYSAYAHFLHKRRMMIRVAFLPEWLAGHWLDFFTPKVHARIGKIMVNSMSNAMVVTHDKARQMFPSIVPRSLAESFKDVATKTDTSIE